MTIRARGRATIRSRSGSNLPAIGRLYNRSRSRNHSHSSPSRSRSSSPGRRHSPIRAYPPPLPRPIHAYDSPTYLAPPSLYCPGSTSRSYSPESSRSPSPPPRRRRYSYRSRTPSPISPIRRSSYPTIPEVYYVPPPPPIVNLPNMTPPPPVQPFVYRQETTPEPVDILTYHYNKNMAYAPAAKTYDVCFFMFLLLLSQLIRRNSTFFSYRRQ